MKVEDFLRSCIFCFRGLLKKDKKLLLKDSHCKSLLTFMARIRFQIVRIIQEINDKFLNSNEDEEEEAEEAMSNTRKHNLKIQKLIKYLSKTKFNIDLDEFKNEDEINFILNPKKFKM